MSKPHATHSKDLTKATESVISAFEKRLEKQPVPVVPRAAVLGAQIHAGRSLERANHAITAAHRSGEIAQVRAGDRLYLVDPDRTDEMLLEDLRAYLDTSGEPDEDLIGAVNARVQDLRNGGDA